jgi:hypothetical protein
MTDIDGILARMKRSEPYFEDRGFTAAVLAALPEDRELPLWVKNLIMVGATAAGSGVVAWQAAGLKPEALLSQLSLNTTTVAVAALFVYAFSSAMVWVVRREIV